MTREELGKYMVFSDAVLGQVSGIQADIERSGALCKKAVIHYANPKRMYIINGKKVPSPFLPHSNDPQVLADLIDKIVESEEFRKDLAGRELEFVKQIADPHKISHEWEKLFDNYMGNIHEKQIISSKEIRNRQNNFFIINRLYLSKIKKKITRNE